jgi:hypothetical protein
MQSTKQPARAPRALLLLGLALTSCTTEALFTDNRAKLQTAYDQFDAGELQEATWELEKLIVQSENEPERYPLQRYVAAWLLARIHTDASLGDPFLTESPRNGTGVFSLQGMPSNHSLPSPIAHQMAVTYSASLGRQWFADAKEAEDAEEGQPLLPEQLDGFSIKSTQAYMTLAMFTVFSRFDFPERLKEVVVGIPELKNLETCEQLMNFAGVSDAMRPWIYRGVFRHLTEVDEAAAYEFGIKALQTARLAKESFSRSHRDAIEDWISEESSFAFVCGKGQCKQRVIPSEPRCLACQQTLSIDFLAVPKARLVR